MTVMNGTIAPEAHRPKRRIGFWLKCALVGLLVVIIGMPTVGVIYEAIMAAGDAQRYPPPGELVSVNGHEMHIDCMGDKSGVLMNPSPSPSPFRKLMERGERALPKETVTVILESEFAGWSLDWVLAQPEIATFARVCSYDRAGYGWSEPSPESRSPRQIATELHTLLANAGIEPPYVLVGHSLGGKYARMFADLFPDEVAGMVLVDARHESLEPQMTPEENAKSAEAYRSSLGLYTLLGRTGVARAFGASLISGLNPAAATLPAETRSIMAIWAGRQQTVDTMIEESADSTANDADLTAAPSLGFMPLTVLVAGTSIDANPRWLDAQKMMAALSTNSQLVIVDGASHTIQWDQPEKVVEAVRGVVEQAISG